MTIATTTLAEGRKREFAPLCVAVLDAGAHVVALLRDDHAAIFRPEIAIGKAAGCLGMGFGGRELERRAAAMPQFFNSLAVLFPKGMVPLAGGILLRDEEGNIVGAVGVSGDTSENDEIAALAGVAASGMTADTGAR